MPTPNHPTGKQLWASAENEIPEHVGHSLRDPPVNREDVLAGCLLLQSSLNVCNE